jgi:hypothetical protein
VLVDLLDRFLSDYSCTRVVAVDAVGHRGQPALRAQLLEQLEQLALAEVAAVGCVARVLVALVLVQLDTLVPEDDRRGHAHSVV